MKAFIAGLFILCSTVQAVAQTTQMCYDIGKVRWSVANGVWAMAGGMNTRGVGSCGAPGNRFTVECFDYDVCVQLKGVNYCTIYLWPRASASWNSPNALDCNNTQSPWLNAEGVYEWWNQANQSSLISGTMYTNGSDASCGQYLFQGTIDGDGRFTMRYTNASLATLPANCFGSFSVVGSIRGEVGFGTWYNPLGQGAYSLLRLDPLKGSTYPRAWRPVGTPSSARTPWKK